MKLVVKKKNPSKIASDPGVFLKENSWTHSFQSFKKHNSIITLSHPEDRKEHSLIYFIRPHNLK